MNKIHPGLCGRSSTLITSIVGLLGCVVIAVAAAQQPAGAQHAGAAPAAIEAKDEGWPRQYEAEGHEVVLHQPQVDAWEDFRLLRMRAAVVVRKRGFAQSAYGAIKASTVTRVDQTSRTVFLDARKLEEISFPGAAPEDAERLKKIVTAALPDERPLVIALDRVIAAAAQGEQKRVRETQVNLDPPPIHYSDAPAILVIFAGKPRFEKLAGTSISFAPNTNWDVFLDANTAHYYLLNGDHWLVSKDLLAGEWIVAERLPADLSRLPQDENWSDVRANMPPKKVFFQTKVIASTTPAELIVTEGPPQREPIDRTKLMLVTNTDADLFLHSTEQQYYYLTGGRWFRAKALTGPWSAATRDLPADFAAIPEESPVGEILASVPGTPQALEAVIQASIPQRATVNRNEVSVTVTYDGEPRFVPIENTKVQYAVNTPYSVFLVEGAHYCCHQGVWFTAGAAAGPWSVATSIPSAIYSIPPSHPAHNVTYVQVYESTPETVEVGTTAGYSGQYVSSGVVLFGAGAITGAVLDDDDDDDWYYGYAPYYFSYGCGAYYSYYDGTFFAGGRACYGPYGGAGAYAAYNPATGVYSRGAYRYGPAGSAHVRQAYNPWTGNYAARAGGSNAYGSWGRGVVSDGDNWARSGYRSGDRGTVGGIRTSEGSGIAVGRVGSGPGTAVGKDQDGDLFVGRNGNLYKREDGSWYGRQDGDWKPADAQGRPREEAPGNLRSIQDPPGAARDLPPRPGGPDVGTGSRSPGSLTSPSWDLDTQGFSRDRGSYSAERATQRSSAGAPSRGRARGGRR